MAIRGAGGVSRPTMTSLGRYPDFPGMQGLMDRHMRKSATSSGDTGTFKPRDLVGNLLPTNVRVTGGSSGGTSVYIAGR